MLCLPVLPTYLKQVLEVASAAAPHPGLLLSLGDSPPVPRDYLKHELSFTVKYPFFTRPEDRAGHESITLNDDWL